MLHPLWQVVVLFIWILIPNQCKISSKPMEGPLQTWIRCSPWEVGESLERLHSQSSVGSNAMGWVSAQTEFHVNHFRLVTWQKCDLKAVNNSQGKRSVLVESHHSFRACEKCQCEENNGFTPSHHQHQARIIIFSSSHCTHLLFKKDSLSKEYKSGLHDINLGHDSAGLEDSRTPHSGCP